MTIKLRQNINQFKQRLLKKSENSNYTLKLKSNFSKKEFIFNIVDITPLEFYSTFIIDTTSLEKGDYVFIIYENDLIINRTGIAYIV